MIKQTHCCWILGIGILLVLIGVGIFVQVGSSHAARLPQENLAVAEAVTQLEGCVTCHEITNASPAELASMDRMMVHAPIALPESKPHARAFSPVETRLKDAGQRILALSVSNAAPQVTTAADDFLRIYDQYRTASGSAADQLTALDNLEYWLRILENQAQTTRWTTTTSSRTQFAPAAWITSGAMSSGFTAALSPHLSDLTILIGRSTILHDEAADRLLDAVIFGLHRRGPPVGAPIGVV